MANVAQLIRRQSSRELLRVPLDRLELRELQHRLLPTPSDQTNAGPALYGTTNAAFVEDGSTPSSSSPSIIQQQVGKIFRCLLVILERIFWGISPLPTHTFLSMAGEWRGIVSILVLNSIVECPLQTIQSSKKINKVISHLLSVCLFS